LAQAPAASWGQEVIGVHWYLGSGSSWWAWGLGIALIIFWALVVWAVVALVRWAHGGHGGAGGPGGPGGPDKPPGPGRPDEPHSRADPAEDLARQYATGQINVGEYHRRLDSFRSRAYASSGSRS
jgi:putative membrane protein